MRLQSDTRRDVHFQAGHQRVGGNYLSGRRDGKRSGVLSVDDGQPDRVRQDIRLARDNVDSLFAGSIELPGPAGCFSIDQKFLMTGRDIRE